MPNNSSKLISLLFVIGRRMRDEMKRNNGQNASSWLHFETLRYVSENGKPLMRDVATYFSITPPAATLLIDGLVASKMLKRVVGPKDRRTVRVAITSRGKQVMEQGIRERMKKIKELFAVLTAREHEELVSILTKMAAYK
jgi:DNA-binding MarR family transcriptional regulator